MYVDHNTGIKYTNTGSRKRTRGEYKILEFMVRVSVPAEVPISELKQYIRDAVNEYGGNRHQFDPLFDSDKRTTVRLLDKSR